MLRKIVRPKLNCIWLIFDYCPLVVVNIPDIHKTSGNMCSKINFHKNVPKRSECKLKIFNLTETDGRTNRNKSILHKCQVTLVMLSCLLYSCFYPIFDHYNRSQIACMSRLFEHFHNDIGINGIDKDSQSTQKKQAYTLYSFVST